MLKPFDERGGAVDAHSPDINAVIVSSAGYYTEALSHALRCHEYVLETMVFAMIHLATKSAIPLPHKHL